MTLTGDLEFSAAHPPRNLHRCTEVNAFLDSGAFTDPPEKRLSPEDALARQLRWEQRTAELSGAPGWRASHLISYDRLIDETWVGGQRFKRRWSLEAADSAVDETVQAARYLASQREAVEPRTLVLSAQGVDAIQYRECAAGVLSHARPGDWFGFGGWCILGRHRRLLPEFWATLRAVLPLVRAAGLSHVHLFGVLWLPALGGLLWLADEHGLTVSTDSSKPILDCTQSDPKKAGVRAASGRWQDNVAWWQAATAGLRESLYYQEPPGGASPMLRQLTLEVSHAAA